MNKEKILESVHTIKDCLYVKGIYEIVEDHLEHLNCYDKEEREYIEEIENALRTVRKELNKIKEEVV